MRSSVRGIGKYAQVLHFPRSYAGQKQLCHSPHRVIHSNVRRYGHLALDGDVAVSLQSQLLITMLYIRRRHLPLVQNGVIHSQLYIGAHT